MHPELEYNAEGYLYFNGHEIADLAQTYGTPLYVYSADLMQNSLRSLQDGLNELHPNYLICYSVKANSNVNILKWIGTQTCGADIVSLGELRRCCQASIDADKIVFSGVGKTPTEISEAIKEGIFLFSVESESELFCIASLAQEMGIREVKLSLRINPGVDANTHPYITTGSDHDKFGIPYQQIVDLYERTSTLSGIRICGLGFHIGSQIMDTHAFANAAKILRQLSAKLQKKGFCMQYVDIGGGLGIPYRSEEKLPCTKTYLKHVLAQLDIAADVKLILEPGRFVVGNAGILITQIVSIKTYNNKKTIYIADAAMNDLLRPSLYQAYHEILPHLKARKSKSLADLVGPICESGDFFASDRAMPNFQIGDYAIVCSAGAYGFSMSSNYNSRPRAAEVFVTKNNAPRLIRRRESHADLMRLELDL